MTLLSISGLYQYDQTIFDALHVPEALNKDALIASILIECAELEILLPDPVLLKQSLNYWSSTQLPIWQKLYDTTQFDYNPIWNKDGKITETRAGTRSDNETRALNKGELEQRDLHSTAHTDGVNQVTGFNSNTFQNADKVTSDGTGSDTGTVRRNGTDTGTISRGGSDSEQITRTEQGNIGITTTQQMIEEERKVDQFDIYGYIVESFKSMYCIGVY
jgi:hypothetical protein